MKIKSGSHVEWMEATLAYLLRFPKDQHCIAFPVSEEATFPESKEEELEPIFLESAEEVREFIAFLRHRIAQERGTEMGSERVKWFAAQVG